MKVPPMFEVKLKKLSYNLLSKTMAKAKMWEYNIPIESHIKMTDNPAKLLLSAIGILGDYVRLILENFNVDSSSSNINFANSFFEAYLNTKPIVDEYTKNYIALLNAATYYLVEKPGSCKVVLRKIDKKYFDKREENLENILLWLLEGNYNQFPLGEDEESHFKFCALWRWFWTTGKHDEYCINAAKILRKKIYAKSDNRDLLLIDIISCITIKKIGNSAWKLLPDFTKLDVFQWEKYIRESSFMKELWPSQRILGETGFFNGKSGVVQMPTSSGKTKSLEIIIREAFMTGRVQVTVIVAPFRSLCHEIQDEQTNAFRNDDNVIVKEFSDVQQNDYYFELVNTSKYIIVLTPEKLFYILRHSSELINAIGLIIFDECHQFDTGKRGVIYELLLTSLKNMLPDNVQKILISAVMPNVEVLRNWFIGKDGAIAKNSILATYRSIGFASWKNTYGRISYIDSHNHSKELFFVPRVLEAQPLRKIGRERKQRFFPNKESNYEIALYLGLRLVPQGSIAIFSGRKDTVYKLCEIAIDIYKRGATFGYPIKYCNKEEAEKIIALYEKNLGKENIIYEAASLGFFSHHRNIPHGLRLVTEYAMRNADIKFIICTSTLAQGVNLPIKYLIISGTYQGADQIKVRDFHNLLGRAGRAGMHTEGSVLFADSSLYDNKANSKKGRYNWRRINDLLDQEQQEDCLSSILSVTDPLLSDNHRSKIDLDVHAIIDIYNNSSNTIINKINHQYPEFSLNALKNDFSKRFHLIGAIENFILAYIDLSQENLDNEIEKLAKSTFAYANADDETKKKVVDLFSEIAKNILTQQIEQQQANIYAKSLYPIKTAQIIQLWCNENLESMNNISDNELYLFFWSIIMEVCEHKFMKQTSNIEALSQVLHAWISGKTFYEIYLLASSLNLCYNSRNRNVAYKIEDIIDLCENCFAYEVVFLLGSIIDFANFSNFNTERIELFQKRVKYGLPNTLMINLFELGFSDRVVTSEIAHCITIQKPSKRNLKDLLIEYKDQVFSILKRYPRFFKKQFEDMIK